MARIEIKDVHKAYQEGGKPHPVLRGVSATLDAGQVVALVGRSGSGKSTLLNLLAGIDVCDAGRITIGDTDLGAVDETTRTVFRRRHIGFVFQFFNLLATLTVEENVLLPVDLDGRLDEEARVRARGLLEAVGLGERLGAFPDALSGGEQQRVAVARALVHRPDVVLADEPTGNLDSETGQSVLELFLRLARANRATVVMVTHSADVARAADRVLVLEGGRTRDA
jgi:putative ABC transport system ATP-binding protein